MAKQYDNEMRGMLSKNKYKKEDKHPEYTGVCQIDGQKLKIAAWIKEDRDGKKYFSLAFSEDRAESRGNRDRDDREDRGSRRRDDDNDDRPRTRNTDDIPF